MWIVTAAEMHEVEGRAGIPFETLMENAGNAVFQKVQEVSEPGATIAIACGKGNNGGDGLVVARLAHNAGFKVSCFIAAEEKDLGELCLVQLTRAREVGLEPKFLDFELLSKEHDLWVDALLGTGLNGEVTGPLAQAIGLINDQRSRVISVDIPSGIGSDTGTEMGSAVRATWTIVLGLPKPFLFQGAGAVCSGKWLTADIGLPNEAIGCGYSAYLLDTPENPPPRGGGSVSDRRDANRGEGELLCFLENRHQGSHKGENGHVLVLAGSRRYRGAATLAALGALRAGAGLVTVASIEPVVQAVASQIPEVIFMTLPEENGAIADSALEILQTTKNQFTSCVIGPGLTTCVKNLLARLWEDWTVPTVVDADALNLIAEGLHVPKGQCVLTPHPGEAARLLGTDVQSIQADRFGSARALQAKFRCSIVLKGASSIGAQGNGPLVVNSTGNPGMATGGMGDVLAGVIASLLPNDQAGALGMYWHGLAGDLAEKEIGKIGYSASELAQFLPLARSMLTE